MADGEEAIVLALEDLAQLIAAGHPAAPVLKQIHQATSDLLVEHRRQKPPVVVRLNELVDGLGDFFQSLDPEQDKVSIQTNTITVGPGRQVLHLVEHLVDPRRRDEALKLFLRIWGDQVLPFDRNYVKNRRPNKLEETKYDGDLLQRYHHWLVIRPASV
jgi:hypothetical protein